MSRESHRTLDLDLDKILHVFTAHDPLHGSTRPNQP